MMAEQRVLNSKSSSFKSLSKIQSTAGEIFIEETSDSLRKSSSGIKKKNPRRTIHFSDGVIEEYSTDEDEINTKSDETTPLDTNPRDLTWIPWMFYYVSSSGCTVLKMAESLGESLGWFFGITSPKYYYEIEDYKRMKKEEEQRKTKERENSWETPKDSSVVTLDPTRLSIDLKTLPSSEIKSGLKENEKLTNLPDNNVSSESIA